MGIGDHHLLLLLLELHQILLLQLRLLGRSQLLGLHFSLELLEGLLLKELLLVLLLLCWELLLLVEVTSLTRSLGSELLQCSTWLSRIVGFFLGSTFSSGLGILQVLCLDLAVLERILDLHDLLLKHLLIGSQLLDLVLGIDQICIDLLHLAQDLLLLIFTCIGVLHLLLLLANLHV